MAQKPIHKTARGVEFDMVKFSKQNEMTMAVGNASVNARGDKLGPGGQIIKKREDIVAERSSFVVHNEYAPQPEPTPAPTVAKTSKKDLSNQDPEGNE